MLLLIVVSVTAFAGWRWGLPHWDGKSREKAINQLSNLWQTPIKALPKISERVIQPLPQSVPPPPPQPPPQHQHQAPTANSLRPLEDTQPSDIAVAPLAPHPQPENRHEAIPFPEWKPRLALEIQVALTYYGISCGSIDGFWGDQTYEGLRAFQLQQGLEQTGRFDEETKAVLQRPQKLLTHRIVQASDLLLLTRIPPTWLGKSEAAALNHETILERVAESSQAHPRLIRELNPGIDWSGVPLGTVLNVPNSQFPPPTQAARIRISLSNKQMRAFDDSGMLLAHFPCSIGRVAEKRPTGDLRVTVVIKDPNYTFDPNTFPDSEEGRVLGRKLVIPPGPNNPVGVAWIGLDRPGYGIHGTPGPELVGLTESSGCFRLANWNADYLRQLVWVNLPVHIEE